MNVSLKELDCLQKGFNTIFILSDKEAFMSRADLITAVTGETTGSTLFLYRLWFYGSHSTFCWQTISLDFQ